MKPQEIEPVCWMDEDGETLSVIGVESQREAVDVIVATGKGMGIEEAARGWSEENPDDETGEPTLFEDPITGEQVEFSVASCDHVDQWLSLIGPPTVCRIKQSAYLSGEEYWPEGSVLGDEEGKPVPKGWVRLYQWSVY